MNELEKTITDYLASTGFITFMLRKDALKELGLDENETDPEKIYYAYVEYVKEGKFDDYYYDENLKCPKYKGFGWLKKLRDVK